MDNDRRIQDCIRENIPKCFDSCSDIMRMQANKLREEVQKYLRCTRNNAGIIVACDLQSVDLKTTDWTRHVVSLTKIFKLKISFHRKRHHQVKNLF